MKSTSKIRLNVLDQSPIRPGSTAREALLETVQLAQLADRLGYTRFWVSEHHNTNTLAGSTPEVLIAHLGSQTQHLRLGSGGVMLPHYSALKVAENFRLLENLFPGRIDLGMGRAPGGDRLTAHALNPSNTFSEQDFVEQLMDLQAYLRDEKVPDTIHERVMAIPQAPAAPELWLLSSSGQSGLFAAHLGMAFSFAQFINGAGGPAAVRQYRERFRPSRELAAPLANVAVFTFCADTEEKADELRKAMDMQLIRFNKGEFRTFPSTEEVRSHRFSTEDQAHLAFNRNRVVSGTPEQVHAQFTKMAAEYGVDEITAVTITADFQDRLRSYELLAEVFELPAPVAAEQEAALV
ncbi:LLM class flavin-dependent oxidoreductase [Microvirga sp. STS02]|uniref:LLM class flavin-dependent oxidoreductase n=1 Tax=Hymenobacter negativus TaxID=2795026 RepID=UPI0018DE2630|nr:MULTISPECIES: LLM class flavin-dependent oxidoreductase [Bacteria]MBH8567624.1 LLM class flavin-dependent oxidoreductase [Hymenobacter negativus]MBR7207356.1 LLM class flavin-dependent oxidoreductase [Microvirga sp. STS02]